MAPSTPAFTGSRFALSSSDEIARARRPAARARSIRCWSSTWCSARPCRTSRSTRWQTSVTPTGGSSVPVFPGDTLTATSEVIGLKENSNGKTGVVYVRTIGDQPARRGGADLCALGDGPQARRGGGRRRTSSVPTLPARVGQDLRCARRAWTSPATTSPWRLDRTPSRITRSARRSTTSTAWPSKRPSTRWPPACIRTPPRSISTPSSAAKDPSGKRLVYGGVVISTARALSFNGLENAGLMLAINGGRHVNPFFAGGTVFAWSRGAGQGRPGPGGRARCGCGWWRPRIGPAPTSPTRTPRASIRPRSSWTSTTGRRSPSGADDERAVRAGAAIAETSRAPGRSDAVRGAAAAGRRAIRGSC